MKKIIVFLFVLAFLVMPVMAETINYDYEARGGNAFSVPDGGGGYRPITGLYFTDIGSYPGFSAWVAGIDDMRRTATSDYDGTNPGWVSRSSPISFKIGSVEIGTGEETLTLNYGPSDTVVSETLVLEVYTWDPSAYSGAQYVVVSETAGGDVDIFGTSHMNGRTADATVPAAITAGFTYSDYSDCVVLYASSAYGLQALSDCNVVAYNNIVFHQSMTYEEGDSDLSLEILKYGYSNNIKITDSRITLLDNHKSEDISMNVYDYPITVEVTNPFTSDVWSNIIPETAAPPIPDNTAMLNAYVYDAVTRELINNGHNVTVNYDSGSSSETYWPGSISHTTIDWSGESSANVTYSATGYEDTPATKYVASVLDSSGSWLEVGSEVDAYVYLNPLETPSNTTAWVTFEVQEQMSSSSDVYFYSEGAAVTIGNTTMSTGGMGTCTFELSSGTYSYTVQKTGYQTTSGTFSLGSSNQYIGVDLPLMPGAPTPTGQAGVDYPYTDVDPREKAEQSMGIIFDVLPAWASLAVIVVTMSLIGWMKPKR